MFFCRCEDYTISLLEQCEDLREVNSLSPQSLSFAEHLIRNLKRIYDTKTNFNLIFWVVMRWGIVHLDQVETFLQTRNSGNKDTNYMLAILDSR